MSVLMGDDEGEKPIIALKKLLVKTRLERDSARATIAERDKLILTLEEQLAKALKALAARDDADIASPAPTPAAEDFKGGVKAFSTPVRGGLEWQATSVAKKLMKKREDGVLDSPDTRMKRPGFTPGPLPPPSPADPEPSKKSEKKKGFPWI